MSRTFAGIVFDDVSGVITPSTVPVVQSIENPSGTPAVELLPSGSLREDPLVYRGFFTTSQCAALFTKPGTVVNADDETGATVQVLIRSVNPSEHVARCGGVAGVWVECRVTVTAWP